MRRFQIAEVHGDQYSVVDDSNPNWSLPFVKRQTAEAVAKLLNDELDPVVEFYAPATWEKVETSTEDPDSQVEHAERFDGLS